MRRLHPWFQTPSTTAPAALPAGLTPRVETIERPPTGGVPETRIETMRANQTFVIAEAGSCHQNEWEMAVELVRVAVLAGADAVKFQYWSSAERLADRRKARHLLATYAAYQLPVHWIPLLAHCCAQWEIAFMCTTYLPEDIPVVAPHVAAFKVASFEALDQAFIDQHPRDGRNIIVSLGMVTEAEMRRVLARRRPRLTSTLRYLHCVSGYPTPLNEVNLSVIRHYMLDGFSDHTGDVRMGADAVLAGAKIVEVHIRLEGTLPDTPDYSQSLPPADLTRYIGNIRAAEVRLGSPIKAVQPSERANRAYRVAP